MVNIAGRSRIDTYPHGRRKAAMSTLPVGWRFATLADVARLESGHTPSRRNRNYWGGDIPWLSLHDVDALAKNEIVNTAQSVTALGIANSSARVLPRGTVAFSRTATVGKATVLGREMATSQDFACYVCGPEVYNLYLVYLFRSMTLEWKKLMAGSIHNTIYMPVFENLRVVLPPYAEQRAIAAALADADSLIDALESLVAKKRAIKSGAMRELLTGRRRLAGFSGKWSSMPLSALGLVLNGLTYSPENVRDNGTLVLRASNIFEGALRFEDNVFVQMEVPKTAQVEQNDILVCVRNGSRNLIGKAAKIDARCKGMAFGAFMAVFRTEWHGFILQQFQSDLMRKQIVEHLGATINQITNKSLKSFVVPVPPSIDEAFAISDVLEDMDMEIAALKERIQKAQDIKVGIMRELMSGRKRLI